MKTYYHFCAEDRRLGYGDGRQIRVGETLTVDCEPVLCHRGLHACRRVIDALVYAPGTILTKVTLGGTVIHGDGKSVATERTVVAIADCTDILRDFARRCALDVIHLWDAPEVVERYLRTGDESIRETAETSAWAAARADAWADARAAAGAAAGAAARAAAEAAARADARAAAGAAAGAAARAAAGAAARAAAEAAAGAAARADAWAAAWAAARAAAQAKQNRRLAAMLSRAQWETEA